MSKLDFGIYTYTNNKMQVYEDIMNGKKTIWAQLQLAPLFQVPPLTPSTNKKVNEVLKTTYSTWEKDSERLGVPKDPRIWTKEHVGDWLNWAIREFSLAGPNSAHFAQQLQVRIIFRVEYMRSARFWYPLIFFKIIILYVEAVFSGIGHAN